LVNDLLLNGRQGIVVTDSIQTRIERTIEKDFAFGGLGVDLARLVGPGGFERGQVYAEKLLTLPIPRILYPEKFTVDPNLEMTEAYTGNLIAKTGTIILFTPIGEALFYLGYFGLIIIPFFYGFIIQFLSRIYSSSRIFVGLLAQVYIWAFLGMRLSFWNVYGELFVLNFSLLACLLIWNFLNIKRNSVNPALPFNNG
jgi:hypothetical protein